MAEKSQNQYHPPESNGYHRNDQESLQSMEEQRKKRMKWTIGIIAFILFQVVQALFFILVIMKFKSPKFRIGDNIQFVNHNFGNQSTPLFDMSFTAPMRIKNTNWGPFKYDAGTVNFTYGGIVVGQVPIPKGKANFKSTKKFDVNVTVNSAVISNTSNLKSELSSGAITLNSQGELNGKITVMFMFKKKKISQMNCTIIVNTTSQMVQSLTCE